MGSGRLRGLVWPGMILAGVCLGAAVLAAWPEPTTRIVRLPYGESQPKVPDAVWTPQRPAAALIPDGPSPAPPTAEAAKPARALASVEPAVDSAVTEDFDPADGPAPVPSPAELEGDYVQESPEELGAEPLPGTDVTPAPPPAVG